MITDNGKFSKQDFDKFSKHYNHTNEHVSNIFIQI